MYNPYLSPKQDVLSQELTNPDLSLEVSNVVSQRNGNVCAT